MTPSEAFADGVAVVTGAGSGIGEGIARAAAGLGMKVVLADIAADRIARVAAEIRDAGGTALPVVTDVADAASVQALAATTHERFGGVRLLVNNAGIELVGCSWELPAEAWERALRVNVLGVIHGTRAFLPGMIARAAPAYVANLSSIGGISTSAWEAPYIVSKHAVLAFTECLSLELQVEAPHVHVAAVLPGPVTTRIFEDAPRGPQHVAVAQHLAEMKQLLAANGMPPDEAARLILEGIAARRFWVSSHPEMVAYMASMRGNYLATLATPSMAVDIAASVGH
jgi:NADP-dependent 3-hydroxy acid dehydrogenase YdfG